MSILLPSAPVIFLLAWFGWRIACKAGYSGLWGLTALVPPLGLLALWYLAANKDWPERTIVSTDKPIHSVRQNMTIRRPTEPVRHRQG
jgi:hypothetical protein